MQTISKDIKSRVLTISPSDAKGVWEDQQLRYSDGRCSQRNVVDSVVNKYASDMKAGVWAVTHQGLAFDQDGNLIDGQHRLLAIISAGLPIKIMVTTGLPPKSGRISTIDAIDSGRVRTHGDKLHMHGIKNANLTAGCANAIAMGVCGSNSRSLSFTQVADIIHIYSTQIQDAIGTLSLRKKMRSAYIVGPFAFALAGVPSLAGEAARMLALTEFSGFKSPVAALNRAIEDGRIARVSTSSMKTVEAFKLVAATLFAMNNKSQVTHMRPSQESLDWLIQTQIVNVRKVMQIVKGVK